MLCISSSGSDGRLTEYVGWCEAAQPRWDESSLALGGACAPAGAGHPPELLLCFGVGVGLSWGQQKFYKGQKMRRGTIRGGNLLSFAPLPFETRRPGSGIRSAKGWNPAGFSIPPAAGGWTENLDHWSLPRRWMVTFKDCDYLLLLLLFLPIKSENSLQHFNFLQDEKCPDVRTTSIFYVAVHKNGNPNRIQ